MDFFRDVVLAAASQGGGQAPAPYVYTNTEASDLAARMTNKPNNTRSQAIDTLIGALKSGATSASNIWAKLDALYVLAAADKQAALLNWKGATYDLTENGTGTFTADQGWAGDGSTGYLDTGFAPSTAVSPVYALNSACIGLYSRTAAQEGAAGFRSIATGTSSPLTGLGIRSTANSYSYQVNGAGTIGAYGSVVNSSVDGAGLFIANRPDGSTIDLYRNAVSLLSAAKSASALPSTNILISKASTTFSARQVSAALIGGGLTSAEVTDLYNALSAYMTTVGAA